MLVKNLVFMFSIFILVIFSSVSAATLPTKNPDIQARALPYLLPEQHFLRDSLEMIFKDPQMFESVQHFKKAGFQVKVGNLKFMVGVHPYISQYVFKKFPNHYSEEWQLQNYIQRIKGANLIRKYIKKQNFKHLIVPKKWLYKLPQACCKEGRPHSYVLIAENMHICNEKEIAQRYYDMDREALKELCMTLHAVGGCDALARNQPFTCFGKIAFVDTEHAGEPKKSQHFLKNIVPILNPELQDYATSLWMYLEETKYEASHINED
jgi:hypothetical protein